MGINLFSSNKLKVLAKVLSTVISRPLSSPFVKEHFIVQSKGMERYINLTLADSDGISANMKFMFPNQLVDKVFEIFVSDFSSFSYWERDSMTFRIMGLLSGNLIEKDEFRDLKGYINSFNSGLKCFQISSKIADIFDQYLLYRPEMIKQWEKGFGNHWQAILYREIASFSNEPNRINLFETFEKNLNGEKLKESGVERLNIFGISSLPAYHIEVISRISDFIDVNFFSFNPSGEYWGDQLTTREILKARENLKEGFEDHIEPGNQLLSSMGKSGRDFFDLLQGHEEQEFELYDEYKGESLLDSIKNDIFKCSEDSDFERDESDNSISFHSSHTEFREIEILKDNILNVIEEESVNPEEIIVMAPDIEDYTPFINAVFGSESDKSLKIPYSISDRTALNESSLIKAFFNILKLPDTRLEASNVLAVLENEVVMIKFELSAGDLLTIRKWIKESGIRWGIDGEHKTKEGLPFDNSFTWDHGLKRMFTGYAMTSNDEKIFSGILPYDEIEGSSSEILGKLHLFISTLFDYLRELTLKRDVEEWTFVLKNLLNSFFIRDDSTERDYNLVIETLEELLKSSESAKFSDRIELSSINSFLSNSISKKAFGGGFISRGITFCSMLPMRSIPFKCIFLIGMNDDKYPKSSQNTGFDLIAKYPKKGDRSKRDDDRYLFLETVLSAEKILCISYVGQSIRDNSKIPPSVIVSELMDYIDFKCKEKDTSNLLTTVHPLQPFSMEYFSGRKLFSYSREYYDAALSSFKENTPASFTEESLDDPPKELLDIDLALFLDFFQNPSKFILNRRAGIFAKQKEELTDDREPFLYTPLEAHKIEKKILDKILEGTDPEAYLDSLKMSGNLPSGKTGEYLLNELLKKVRDISDDVKRFTGKKSKMNSLRINYQDEILKVSGFLNNVAEVMINFRYGSTKGKDVVDAWIKHLFLNSLDEAPKRSLLFELTFDRKTGVWNPSIIEFTEVQNTSEILKNLSELYFQGLKKPLKFFPQSSYEYATTLFQKGKDETQALFKADRAFNGNSFQKGEKFYDDNFGICFRENPVDEEFALIAEKVFEPMFSYMKRKDFRGR